MVVPFFLLLYLQQLKQSLLWTVAVDPKERKQEETKKQPHTYHHPLPRFFSSTVGLCNHPSISLFSLALCFHVRKKKAKHTNGLLSFLLAQTPSFCFKQERKKKHLELSSTT
jgi:hypothetical protein